MKLIGIKKVNEFDLYDITVEDDHCFELENGIIAHNSMYPTAVISGGTGIIYSSNTAFIITKSQEKEGTEIVGYNFTINIEKSRFVREKSKFPFTVKYDGGIQRYSGLMDIAIEAGVVVKPSNGFYQKVNLRTGEPDGKKYRMKETNSSEFWGDILQSKEFNEYVNKRYKLGYGEYCHDNTDEKETGEFHDYETK